MCSFGADYKKISDSCLFFKSLHSVGGSIPRPTSFTSWKFPKSLILQDLCSFPFPQNNRFLKDRFKMLNFPSFFKAFGLLQAIN